MASKKKLLQAAAGSAGGAGLDVDEVFSTYLYEGTGSAQTITNNIDLSGEGGLVWIKDRDLAKWHKLYDTERGATKALFSNETDAENTNTTTLTSFNSNGFTLGAGGSGNNNSVNESSGEYASWTFRKAPKWFDVQTWTGSNFGGGRQISHNLGSVPGIIIIKRTSAVSAWYVWHRSRPNAYTLLDQSDAEDTSNTKYYFGDGTNVVAPTSTEFTTQTMNENGFTYVAYLFAHNNNDGEFGPSADQDVIKCGSFTPPSSGEQEVSLGFEPQFIITFDTGGGDNWRVYDTMRGWDVTNRQLLNPNGSAAESSLSNTGGYEIKPTATGFIHEGHTASSPHIYMAIRRGPLAAPENATDVFNVNANTTSGVEPVSGFVTDFAIAKIPGSVSPWYLTTRLQGTQYLSSHATDAEATINHTAWDRMDGAYNSNMTSYQLWHWKRAPSYFDVVAYSGTGSARTISHNLGAVPEMMWVKSRSDAHDWVVYHSALGNGTQLNLNTTNAAPTSSSADYWNLTTPTDSVFTLGSQFRVNGSSKTYIAYLFATVAGVSKVGSVNITNTGNFNVDCGFSNGARFVMVKAFNQSAPWYVSDSVRGINAGSADPLLFFDNNQATNTASDWIEPYSAGFTIKGNFYNGYNLIFYAIA